MPALRDLNRNEEFYCQQDRAPHIPIATSGATWLNFQAGCRGRRGSVEYQPRSLDLTPLDFHLLMYVKDAAFLIKPTTREALREDMEGSWAASPVYTHSSAEFRSVWILAVNISKVCPNSKCAKEPSVYNKHPPPLNNLRGILCTLNCLCIFSRVMYIVLLFNAYDQPQSTLLPALHHSHFHSCWKHWWILLSRYVFIIQVI